MVIIGVTIGGRKIENKKNKDHASVHFDKDNYSWKNLFLL